MSRRGNGEGSVYRRRDGRWAGAVSLPNGKRATVYGATREEAATKLTAALRGRDQGLPVVDGQQTVGAYLNSWLVSVRPSLRPRTHQRYESLIRLQVKPAIGKVRLAKLTPQHLSRLYADLIAGGLSPTTTLQVHRVVRRALDQAARWGMVARNVAALVDAPRKARHEMRTLTTEEAQRLLTAAAGRRLEALYVLAVTTGMRQGELLALRWQDVDIDGGTVRVTGTLQQTKAGPVIAEPKTSSSRRQIVLSERAVSALKRHRKAQAEERLAVGEAWDGTWGVVFANEVGRPINASNLLTRDYRPLLRAAELSPAVRFHDLRHTAATLLLLANVHPKVVSEMLGHANIGITLNTYSHVLPTMQREAAAMMDAVLG
jgi:integrase